MATDVKQLLLQIDASVESLRRNLNTGQARIDRFTADTQRQLDAGDRRFARFGQPLGSGLTASVAAARREIASIGATVSRTEDRIRASSGGIKAALLGSTSGIAAAFSADRVKDYADAYTRYTNQLKVAGLEGQQLAKTQGDLFTVAQRNGVELEAVGTLYGKAATSAKELGASNADLLRFTSGVSAALRVQGGSTESASGALQQLGQLLGSSRVQAEEFNSVADGARPILQAVARNIDGAGGSVSKLKQLVNDGKVSNTDFFRAFLKGSADLETQAAKANLTIAASLTILNNALGKYIGETDAGLSATARVSEAIISLSQNLDTIVPALAIVGTAFATRFVAGPITAVGAEILLLAKALDSEKLVLIGGKVAAAQKAEAMAAAASTEVAAIEATIAARRQDQEAIAQTLVLIEAQRAESLKAAEQQAFNSKLNFGLGRAVTSADAGRTNADLKAQLTTKRALAVVDAELIELETALAAAQGRAAVATTAAATATAELTLASRASAAASKLFAGTLTLIGGSVAGGAAVLTIGALVGAILLYRNAAEQTEERNRATAESMKHAAAASRKLNADLVALASSGPAAASGITQAGGAATSATGKMLTFAGAVGEAADKLRQLAEARRREEILNFARQSTEAEHEANLAAQRINARNRSRQANRGFQSQADATANADDAALVVKYRGMQSSAYQAAQTAARRPLDSRIRESDRNGGRDVDGDLERVTRDLTVARRRGIKAQVQTLEAQKYELTQYKDYRKQGLSPQAAQEAASRDAGAFRSADRGAQGDRDARAGRRASARADRQTAATSRREAAQVRDAASDERAFSAAERQATNDIAAARADLTNSAIERAQIEKARIEAERISRNNEIAQQVKQGGLGDGVEAQTRALALQKLNDRRAALETELVDARERQRSADETLMIEQADRGSRAELLRKQADLVTTAGQRRDIEQKILDLQYEEERAKLDAVIASRDSTEAEREIARRRKAMLSQLQTVDKRAVDRQNEGPLDQYRRRLQATSGDMNEALQGVAVDGLQTMQDGLLSIVTGTESVGSAFKKMAASIIADLARIAIQKAILAAIGAATGTPGLATGGRIEGRASGGRIQGRAGGGRISGPGTGISDSILALIDGRDPLMVSNGESVVTAKATAEWWPIIDAMNKGKLQRLAGGGMVGGASTGSLAVAPTPRIAGMRAGGMSGRMTLRVALSDDLHATIDKRAVGVAVEVVRATAPEIIDAASAQTIAAYGRPRI